MAKREKRRKSIIDDLFGTSLSEDTERFFEELGESGYSISVVQTSEGTKVKAKVSKDADVNALRKQLEKEYPNAKIEIEGGQEKPLVRELSTKTIKENNKKQNSK